MNAFVAFRFKQILLLTAMARASNTLSVAEYEKILLGNKTSVLRSDLAKSLEDFCAVHEKLVVDLFGRTQRPC